MYYLYISLAKDAIKFFALSHALLVGDPMKEVKNDRTKTAKQYKLKIPHLPLSPHIRW